jgi:hypothetical protein
MIFTVAGKVCSLFLMMLAGVLCARAGMITKRGAQQITSLLFYVITPCLIVSSLQSVIGKVSLGKIVAAGGFTLLSQAVGMLLSLVMFRRQPPERRGTLRFAVIYSNCGFMGLPLAQSLLGDAGAAYASIFMVVYNVFVWTHGIAMMGGASDWKKVLLNPGMVGFFAGMPFYLFSVHLPPTVFSAVDAIGSMNTPLAMIVVGHSLSYIKWRDFFSDSAVYSASAARLVLVPLLFFGAAVFLHQDAAVFTTCLLLTAAPVAGNTTMFSIMLGRDGKLASQMVAVSTLLSVFTMPVFAALASAFAGG